MVTIFKVIMKNIITINIELAKNKLLASLLADHTNGKVGAFKTVVGLQGGAGVGKSESIDQASKEFADGALKSNADDVVSLLIGNDVPARAAEPNGHSFIRSLASVNLDRSLLNIST